MLRETEAEPHLWAPPQKRVRVRAGIEAVNRKADYEEADPPPFPCGAPRTIGVKGEPPDKRLEFSSLEKPSGPTEMTFRH